jgi:hypothetical protein
VLCLAEFLLSPTVAVGQIARHPGCFCMLGAVWFAVAVGVANTEDEPPPSLVRSANFRSREHSRRCEVAQSLQVTEDMVENAVVSGRFG